MIKALNFKLFRILLLFLPVINPVSIQAQYYAGGQSPGSLKWDQINSAYFQIIFPKGYENQANYLANILEYARVLDGKTLQNFPRKISVLLHNRSANSNAEVGWAPRRIEFFTQSPQDSYAQEWLQQLALHEYRHVVQLDKMNQGITKLLYVLFGQQITAGVYGLFVPWWFIEGDAVVTETALSRSGRGRQPLFEMELRAQLLQKGSFSYDKAAHGSYRDFTTSHYHLGYYLVGYGRAKYGSELWSKALDNVAKYPFTITPFSNSLKKQTGLNKANFYRSSLADLDSIWKEVDGKLERTAFQDLTKSQSFIDYQNPIAVSKEQIIAFKDDYQSVSELVLLDSLGKEQKVSFLALHFKETLSSKNGVVCWAEYDFDPRWAYQSFTKIVTYSLKSKEKIVFSAQKRYFSPALNSDASKVVVAESSVNDEHSLAIIELLGGLKEKEFKTLSNDFFSYPNWSANDTKLVAVCLNDQGKSLVEFDIASGRYSYLLPFSAVDISKPIYWRDYILYQAAYTGISNIYALRLSDRQIYQITTSAFGAHSPQIWNGQLLYSEYTANGNQIALSGIDSMDWKPMLEAENSNFPLAEILQKQEDTLLLNSAIPQKKYEIKKYSKIGHLINPHSWGPFSFSMDTYGFKPGATMSSQNKLSTLIMSLGYEYDLNFQEGTTFAEIAYLGWYPAIDARVDYGYRQRIAHDARADSNFILSYNETNLRTAVYVPLFFSSGTWSQRIQPRLEYSYKQLDVMNVGVELKKSNYQILSYSIQCSNFQKSAKQALFPKWGQQINFIYLQSPFDESGSLFAFNSAFYFPGFAKHHGLRVYVAYQNRIGDADFYANQIVFSRGYIGLSFEEPISYKMDYKLPLAYPDFNIGSLLYLKRISLGLFYDETFERKTARTSYRSVGNDLLFEVHFLRSFIPFELGLRSVYLLENKSPYFGFLGTIKI